jgi:hypothetical protein
MKEIKTQRRRKLVQAVTLDEDLQKRLVELALARDWSNAQTGGYLIKLGFEKIDQEFTQVSASTQSEIETAATGGLS